MKPDVITDTKGLIEFVNPNKADPSAKLATAAGQRGDVAVLKQIGFDGYLAKPVRPNQLRDCIALVLGRSVEAPDSVSLQKLPEIITRHTVAEFTENSVRILLAEDNIINQKVMLSMLNKLGYKTDAVADGQEALRALELINYDLVLMDCMMPEMDGLAATAEIRNMASLVLNHSVPVIAVTANAMNHDRDACFAAGMNDFLAKPVRKEILAEVLKKWLFLAENKDTLMNEPCDQPNVPLLFDEAGLLDQFDGDRDFPDSILDDALQELPVEMKTLNELAMGDDALAISHQAHTMKGLAANIYTPALREICYRIETAAHDNNLESVRKLLPELEQIVSATAEAIRNRQSI